MPFRPVILKPGPKVIAACAQLAGFSPSIVYPDVVDGCGVTWKAPSALLLAVAVCAGESSGNAWAYNINFPGSAQQSTDFGPWEINNMYNQEWFGPIGSPLQVNWAIPSDNALMAYQMWSDARVKRLAVPNADPGLDWLPWHAYSGGGYKRERYQGKSWLDWAQHGITQVEAGIKAGATLDYLCSVDNDPLVYWE